MTDPPSTGSSHLGQGLHHVAVRTPDYDASMKFYTQTLGFSVKIAWKDAPKRACMIDTGQDNYIELFERPDEAPTPAKPEPTIMHLCLRTDDCDATVEKVRAEGYKITMEPLDVEIDTTQGPHPVPVRIAFCQGPAGEIVEFFQNELT